MLDERIVTIKKIIIILAILVWLHFLYRYLKAKYKVTRKTTKPIKPVSPITAGQKLSVKYSGLSNVKPCRLLNPYIPYTGE